MADKQHRVVVVALHNEGGSKLPDPALIPDLAEMVVRRAERASGSVRFGMKVFPRFGQFSIDGDDGLIRAIETQPEVETVLENDSLEFIP